MSSLTRHGVNALKLALYGASLDLMLTDKSTLRHWRAAPAARCSCASREHHHSRRAIRRRRRSATTERRRQLDTEDLDLVSLMRRSSADVLSSHQTRRVQLSMGSLSIHPAQPRVLDPKRRTRHH
jgi:hypothetical protein